jgi:Putative beta barrel porin-7 (BBP7)
MMKRQLSVLLAATSLTFAALAGEARAQMNLPFGPSNYEHDFQLFAPLELDLDNSQEDQYSGYFFDYQKLFWSYSGERTMVGNPDVVAFAETIYRDNPLDQGSPPPPPQIFNTLTDVPPDSGFAFGNRYELGYRDKGNGWMIGILDGPQLSQGQFYGFGRRADGGLPPFIEDDYTGPDDIGPPNRDLITADPGLRAFGFGSVPVLFEAPEGYLVGFRDYLNFLAETIVGTQGGPFLYVGNYALTTEPDVDDDTIPVFRIVDDIDGDGITGSTLVITPDGIGFIHDFDDLHTFQVYFDNVLVQNVTETDGVEAMWSHDLANNHYMAKNQNNRLTLSVGARYLKLYDEFRVDAQGSILHNAFWDTSFTNQIVGPQVALSWLNQRQRWTLETSGRFMFGYNEADWDQLGLIGEGLIPSGTNQPLYARPTAFSHSLTEREFSPVAEMRLQAKYNFTRSFSMKFGYTGSYIGNIKRAAQSVRYRLPDLGYQNAGTQDLLMNGFDLGVEFVH